MKTFKRILIGLLVLIVLLVAVAGIYVYHISHRSVPDYNQQVELRGLTDSVSIMRDKYGVPHIKAQNENDLYRVTGYLMAQDRLWQMDLLRRATQGRLSELFGADFVDIDLQLRSLRMTEKSKTVIEQAPPKATEALLAFADGVNQFMEQNESNLPLEFALLGYEPEKWEPEHSINLVGYMAWDLSTAWLSEITLHKIYNKVGKDKTLALLPDYSDEKNVQFSGFRWNDTLSAPLDTLQKSVSMLEDLNLSVFSASNNWVVSGKKSVTGKPILCNDMHLGISAPGIWYQIHQVVEGKLDVTGVALPGQYAVVAGHTDRVAWGFTNVMMDDMDFYLETTNPQNPNQYKVDGVWRDMEVRKEKIQIKGGEVVERELRFTHRGPVISGFKGITDKVISMAWTGNQPSNELRTLYLANRMKNWNDFREAFNTFKSVHQNVVYADVDGNIGMQMTGGIPRRTANPIAVLSGETSANDWKGVVPFDSLPYEFNPERGYLSSANAFPVKSDYPHYISTWFYPSYRLDRINDMLKEKEKLGIEDMQRMLTDFKSVFVARTKDKWLAELKNIKDLTDAQKQALDAFSSWDGIMSADKAAPAIFDIMYVQFIHNTLEDEMGDELLKNYMSMNLVVSHAFDNLMANDSTGWFDNVTTQQTVETKTDIIQQSFRQAVDSLLAWQGQDVSQWQWGKTHGFRIRHPLAKVEILDKVFKLNRGVYPMGGSFHTVSPYSYKLTAPFIAETGSSHRHIYSTADWNSSLTVIPTGISGVPASKHYCDQTELYINGVFHNDYFDWQQISNAAEYRTTFKPTN